MPKFYRQNKKRIDPRYFLNETTNKDLEEQENNSQNIDPLHQAAKGPYPAATEVGPSNFADEPQPEPTELEKLKATHAHLKALLRTYGNAVLEGPLLFAYKAIERQIKNIKNQK